MKTVPYEPLPMRSVFSSKVIASGVISGGPNYDRIRLGGKSNEMYYRIFSSEYLMMVGVHKWSMCIMLGRIVGNLGVIVLRYICRYLIVRVISHNHMSFTVDIDDGGRRS